MQHKLYFKTNSGSTNNNEKCNVQHPSGYSFHLRFIGIKEEQTISKPNHGVRYTLEIYINVFTGFDGTCIFYFLGGGRGGDRVAEERLPFL